MLGSVLLFATGVGAGQIVCISHHRAWRQIHTWAQLLLYWENLLQYQALTDRELVGRALLYPEFVKLGLTEGTLLETLPLPRTLPPSVVCEIQQGIQRMALEPRKAACATLQRLASLCEQAAEQRRQKAETAGSFWPRIGGCLGVLAAILFW